MIIKMFTVGALYTNCYVVGCNETKEALIIDPGFDTELVAKRILSEAVQLELQIKYIVNTHGHSDHIAGNGIVKKLTNAPILIHEYDAPMLTNATENLTLLSGLRAVSLPPADQILHNGDTINVGEVALRVLHTPGHSRGSISLVGDDDVFTGDTLWAGTIGRYDLLGGSLEEIKESLKKLMMLPDHMKIYPGHGSTSTIGEEKRSNPFLQNFFASSGIF